MSVKEVGVGEEKDEVGRPGSPEGQSGPAEVGTGLLDLVGVGDPDVNFVLVHR